LVAAGNYEEAISCHGKAAGRLCDTTTVFVTHVKLEA